MIFIVCFHRLIKVWRIPTRTVFACVAFTLGWQRSRWRTVLRACVGGSTQLLRGCHGLVWPDPADRVRLTQLAFRLGWRPSSARDEFVASSFVAVLPCLLLLPLERPRLLPRPLLLLRHRCSSFTASLTPPPPSPQLERCVVSPCASLLDTITPASSTRRRCVRSQAAHLCCDEPWIRSSSTHNLEFNNSSISTHILTKANATWSQGWDGNRTWSGVFFSPHSSISPSR